MAEWQERAIDKLKETVTREVESGGAERPANMPAFETFVGSGVEFGKEYKEYWLPGLKGGIGRDDELALYSMLRGSVMRLQHHKMLADLCRNMAALKEIESNEEVQRVEDKILDWCASPSTTTPKWAEWAQAFDAVEPEEAEAE